MTYLDFDNISIIGYLDKNSALCCFAIVTILQQRIYKLQNKQYKQKSKFIDPAYKTNRFEKHGLHHFFLVL